MILRHNTSGDIAVTDGIGYAIGEGESEWTVLPAMVEGVPAQRQSWNGTAWLVDMAGLQADRWSEVKAIRSIKENGGCETPLGEVNTDDKSKLQISGTVQMALIAQMASAPFSIAWTMRDNVQVTHNGAAMIAMGVAVGQHVAAVHAFASTLRAEINAAETLEELSAIDIEAGWPGF